MDLASQSHSPGETSPSEPPSGVRRRNGHGDFDERLFTAFVKAQIERVPEHARRLHVTRDRAEDILQRSLEKLCPHRATIDSSHWEAWLWHAMRFRSLEYFKGVRRTRRKELDITLILQEWQKGPSPEVQVYQRECASELLALLDRLPPERRAVVCLYLIDDLPMSEVAARLGIPENTAKDRWRLACADMGVDWERGRARERSKLRIRAFLGAATAVLLALFRHIAASSRRPTGPLLACAACVVVLSPPGDRTPSGGLDRAAVVQSGEGGLEPLPTTSPTVLAVAPILEQKNEPESRGDAARPKGRTTIPPAPASRTMASAPRGQRTRAEREPAGETPDLPDPARMAAARKQLLMIANLLRHGRKTAARDLLRLYRWTFPEDPLPDQHARLAAALAAP